MELRLQIIEEPEGTWSVYGLPEHPVARLGSLSASVDYACKGCSAAPATIELLTEGLYIVVHQRRGWPRRFLGSEPGRAPSVAGELDPHDTSIIHLRVAEGEGSKNTVQYQLHP